eukprot:gene3256-3567_t
MGNSESSRNGAAAAAANANQSNTNTQQGGASPAPSSNAAAATAAPGGANAPPGAYRMPGRGAGQRFYVTIPRGVRPGQHFAVLVNGQQMMVRCPENNRPGDRLIVTAPRSQEQQQYVVTVPANVRPGQQFRVMINNQEVMVTCPQGVRPGQRVTFRLPQQQERTHQAAPNHQLYEVVVPDGVRPGQPFALIAGGQRVMVTCPENVRPGSKIRFQLPIQLTQQQIESIRVNYDKDGWMRCLGADLKFHWVFSKAQFHGDSNKEEQSNHNNSFDINQHASVREIYIDPDTNRTRLRYVAPENYAVETTVKGTTIAYNELSEIASSPFNKKVEWLRAQFNSLRVPWEEGHIKLKVRRQSVLQDSMEAVESIEPADMRKIFRFEFLGEPALDAGGVAREFFEIIAQQLFNPDCGLFLYSSVNQLCMQINPNSGIANEFHLKYFHMAGRILGKALMDGQLTPVHLVQPLYKHLMGWPITLTDLEQIDQNFYRNLFGLRDFSVEELEAMELAFEVTEDKLGVTETVELLPGGSNITVTPQNLSEYFVKQYQYRTLTRIQDQLCELLRGFYDVVPEPLLSVFDFQELELILHGIPTIDIDDWKRNTDYTGEFQNDPNHKVVQWFWEVVKGLESDQKAKLLQFVTGTSNVPAQGFAYLQGNDNGSIRRFTLHGDKNVKVFPRAHTCFNRIDMPIYKTKADIQKYLTMAISMESTGFGIE